MTASWRRRQALQVWDYGSGELITDLQPDTYESMQTCAQYMGEDYLAAAGGFSNIIRVIDNRSVGGRDVMDSRSVGGRDVIISASTSQP